MKKFVYIKGLIVDPELVETAYWHPKEKSICVHTRGQAGFSTGENSVTTEEEGNKILQEVFILPNVN